MAVDNSGTKNNQDLILLRLQSGLGIIIHVKYLLRFSHLQSCKLLTSCGCQPSRTGSELFTSNHLVTSPGQTESNEINEPMKMAHLYLPSHDCIRNIEETSASEALPCTVIQTQC